MIKNKRRVKIIIIMALSGLLLAIGLAVYVKTKNPGLQPQNVQISNVTEKTTTISWTTAQPNKSCLVFSSSPSVFIQKLVFLSQRWLPKFLASAKICDQSETDNHHLNLAKLQPETTYHYQIISNGRAYNQQLYTLKTALFTQEQQSIEDFPTLITIAADRRKASSPTPIYATVLDKSGNPLPKTLVYLNSDQAVNQLSCLTDNTGSYYFDLSQFYDKNLNLISWGLGDQLSISVQDKTQTVSFGRLTPGPDFRL